MKQVDDCIFCRSRGSLGTVEHIVPQSLGNTADILEGTVCDICQNYFAREVEKVALEKTPIAFWRTFFGTRTKRGNLPSVTLTPPAGGRVPATHPHTDEIGFTAHADGSVSVEIDNPETAAAIHASDQGTFRLILTPFHLSALGRFIGKMGLEVLAKHDVRLALQNRYDELRKFVRFGTTSRLWAVYWGLQGEIADFTDVKLLADELIVEHECYRYALGETIEKGHLFAFGIGTDLWVISLANRLPQCDVESCIEGTPLTCVFYPDGSC
jgi:hypothetical protein